MKRLLDRQAHPSKNYTRFSILGVLILLSLLCLEFWTVNRLSIYGDKISQLKRAEDALVMENQVLANSIAQSSSLKVLEKNAKSIGFEEIKNLQYIK